MARKPKEKKVALLRTVKHGDEFHPPKTVLKLPADLADELIDAEAAEPVLAVAPAEDEQDGTDDE